MAYRAETEEIDITKEKLQKFSNLKKNAVRASHTGEILHGDSSRDVSNMENQLVGVDNDLQRIKDRLTQFPLKLETIPIVGMGGIGKTTLARRLYDDPSVVLCFYIRLWVAVSQGFNVRTLLLNLCQLNVENKKTNDELTEFLYKSLKGRRYLIVMDDIWGVEAWDVVKRIFPDDNNGSRIILTSRQKDVAVSVNPESPHHLNLLNKVDSWKLLHDKVFWKDRCPQELEDIGKQIATKCQGLPLAIVVIAGYLPKIGRTRGCWADVADRVPSYVTGDPQQCLDIIAFELQLLASSLEGVLPVFWSLSSRF